MATMYFYMIGSFLSDQQKATYRRPDGWAWLRKTKVTLRQLLKWSIYEIL